MTDRELFRAYEERAYLAKAMRQVQLLAVMNLHGQSLSERLATIDKVASEAIEKYGKLPL